MASKEEIDDWKEQITIVFEAIDEGFGDDPWVDRECFHESAWLLKKAYEEAIEALREISDYCECLDVCYEDNEIWELCR